MAYNPFRVFRLANTLAAKDAKHLKLMHEAIAKCRQVLKSPPPDSFAGKKTREPFPAE
jgi:hypothetical protein